MLPHSSKTNTSSTVQPNTLAMSIASFSDGADGMPVKKLVAQIEPVQDLHGYDHPWPAGGSKNKLPDLTFYGTEKGVILGTTYIEDDKKDQAKITSLPYQYKLDLANSVPSIVEKEAGPQ